MFFILPVGVDYQARRYPVVTFTFIGINVLVYVVALSAFMGGGVEAENRVVLALGMTPAQLTLHGPFTSLFTQVGFFHLLGNMVYLYLFGACVEDLIGRWQFVLFYLAGGLASDLVHIIVALSGGWGEIPLIGASGAVSACIGGFVLLLSRTKINFKWVFWLVLRAWSGDFWLPAWLVISFWFVKDLFFAVLSLIGGLSDGGVAFTAHVGGFVGGLAMIGLRQLMRATSVQGAPATATASRQRVTRVRPNAQPGGSPIFIYDGGMQSGPFTRGQVAELIDNGLFSAGAMFWQEGMVDWRDLSEFE